MAVQPQFDDIPEHLRKLAKGVPDLERPVWYAGTVYGRTAKGLEDATAARIRTNGIETGPSEAPGTGSEQPGTSSAPPVGGVAPVSSQTAPTDDG